MKANKVTLIKKRTFVNAIVFIATCFILVLCGGCNRPAPESSFEQARTTAAEVKEVHYSTTPQEAIQAHKEYLRSNKNRKTDAGMYLVGGSQLVVCATDEETLAAYRANLAPHDPNETVVYELKAYPLAGLERVRNVLCARGEELCIEGSSIRQSINRVVIYVPDEESAELVRTAAGKDAGMLDFKVGLTYTDV